MDLSLKDKTAIVTGGASGLGRQTAIFLAGEGARVLVADLNEENIHKVLAEIAAEGGEADGVRTDVRDFADCERMAARAKERFGSVDCLVAAAGVSGGEKFFLDTAPDEWDLTIDVNVKGVLNSNRAVAPFMVGGKSGAIVNIASEAGKLGEKRMVVYSATKGAVIAFTKAFSLEMGRFGVRVNAICPGVTHTPMIAAWDVATLERAAKFYPLGRLGRPDDIASMITFLLSDRTSWVTGQAISVSGGFGRS